MVHRPLCEAAAWAKLVPAHSGCAREFLLNGVFYAWQLANSWFPIPVSLLFAGTGPTGPRRVLGARRERGSRGADQPRIKAPAEQRYPWDYYKITGVVPAADAFRSIEKSACRKLF